MPSILIQFHNYNIIENIFLLNDLNHQIVSEIIRFKSSKCGENYN